MIIEDVVVAALLYVPFTAVYVGILRECMCSARRDLRRGFIDEDTALKNQRRLGIAILAFPVWPVAVLVIGGFKLVGACRLAWRAALPKTPAPRPDKYIEEAAAEVEQLLAASQIGKDDD